MFFSQTCMKRVITEMMNPLYQNFFVEHNFNGSESISRKEYLDSRDGLVQTVKGIFKMEGIPEEFAWIMMVESQGKQDAVSRSGAVGLFQLMPTTALRYGLNVFWIDERYDAEKNTIAAARYLRRLYTIFHSWDLAIAAYNAGEGCISRALKRNNETNFWNIQFDIPSQASTYVLKVRREILEREGLDLSGLPAPPAPCVSLNFRLLFLTSLRSIFV